MLNKAAQGWVSRFSGDFTGELLLPEHKMYHEARRVWNGMIDREPGAIARCSSVADVVAAIRFARSEGLHISVRGGGHNVAGMAVCQDGSMIDLSLMKQITVEPTARELTPQPGVLWAELDAAAEVYGLATTGGQISHTGIAGLTLGGGLGYLMGKFGSVCDNLLSVEMVTADGEVIIASEEQNAELFWAMRGAGSNFGVVTQFRYRLHLWMESLRVCYCILGIGPRAYSSFTGNSLWELRTHSRQPFCSSMDPMEVRSLE